MSFLHLKPQIDRGLIHSVTPQSARAVGCEAWSYVSFDLYRLAEGDRAEGFTQDNEVILVVVEGVIDITANDQGFGPMGERINVFERTPPHCLYLPGQSQWQAKAQTSAVLAVCGAPAKGDYQMQRLGPKGIETQTRGQGTNTRYINNIAMEIEDVAGSLLVTEVFTPAGNWSSYPPHRHDLDDFPNMTYLEETYYHRLNPAQGFGVQRVFTDDLSLDETMAVNDHDVVLVPKGHHPCGAPYGYEMYYLNVMAGPLRKWRFENHPDHNWIYERDLNASNKGE